MRNPLKFAAAGAPTLVALAAVTVFVFFLFPLLALLPALLFAPALWFYRDPDRTPMGDADAWVSPADGHVVEIIETFDDFVGRSVRIGIFMNGFDVHVNRFPRDGVVQDIMYVAGKKWFAFAPKASEENERMYVRILTPEGRTTLVQIAGIMARRIVCYAKKGDALARGERYGMIKFGSKVDVYLPAGISPAVRVGDRVRAGESVIGVKTVK
ncbi:MAG: phosphatidylserine decarboxylase family protein [Synergistaceae bacterium]|jgi:phosphatidylserine decarboxylase|nr:phosphatidylserine decarboxylase family protein [Synergistaceae bacterium]